MICDESSTVYRCGGVGVVVSSLPWWSCCGDEDDDGADADTNRDEALRGCFPRFACGNNVVTSQRTSV